LSDALADLQDRQQHGNDDEPDGHREEHDDHGFDEGRDLLDGDLDLLVIRFGDPIEDLLELSGLFPMDTM